MQRQAEKGVVNAMTGKRILVIGDVILDENVDGVVRRISPEAPVPIVQFRGRDYRPGGAANAAANIRGLGGHVFLNSVVGKDTQGHQLLAALEAAGVGVDGVIVADERWTTTKTRFFAHSQQVIRIDYERIEALSPARESELLKRVERQMATVDACLISDYAKGAVTAQLAASVIEMARAHGKSVLVDPKGTDYGKYRGATMVKPNLHEVERLFNQEIGDSEVLFLRAGERLLDQLKESALLITRGPLGMSLFRRDVPILHIPSVARRVFDVTGAGDTVAATLVLALSAGAPLEMAARLANHAASIVVAQVGTSQVSQRELLAAMDETSS